MDLLGRKAKARVVALQEMLDGALSVARTTASTNAELLDSVYRLEGVNAQYAAHLREALAVIAEQDRRYDSLSQKLEEATRKPAPAHHVSDEEYEIAWQRDAKLIDDKTAAHLLKQLDFDNAEIALDPDYSPRPDLTY